MTREVLISRARAGGKARGWAERKEALARYHLTPHFCKHCGNMIEVGKSRVADVMKKQFCNSSHAASFNNKAHPERYGRPGVDETQVITAS